MSVPPQDYREHAGGVKKHRTRIRLACEPCRKRRRKCNGAVPCSQCSQYGYSCWFGEPSRPTHSISEEVLQLPSSDGRSRNINSGAILENQSAALEADSARVAIDETLLAPSDETLAQESQKPCVINGGNVHNQNWYHPKYPRSDRAWPFFDPIKGRYCRASSSCVFPKLVDGAVGSKANLRLHSYGWNVNIRPEQQPPATSSIRRFLTLQEITIYSDRFFDAVDPIFHFIGRARYNDRCHKYWASQTSPNEDFEALVSGVVAIGSLFSGNPSMAETQLVEYSKMILDRGTCYAPGRPSLDQAAAWVARTLFLRLTTRPNVCWFASCAAVHIAEAMALHIDLKSARLAPQNFSAQTIELEEARRNLLQCALFLNTMISMEYGRSRVILQPLPGKDKDSDLMTLTRVMWEIDQTLSVPARLEILRTIDNLAAEQPIYALLKFDVAIHVYRQHVHANDDMIAEESKLMLSMIKQGLTIVENLVSVQQPWWSLLCTPFQSLLVLLAMDTDESLSLVQETVRVLRIVANSFPSSLAAEALRTAHLLAAGLKEKKLSQAQLLAENESPDISSMDVPSLIQNWTDGTDTVSANSAMMDNWLFGGTDWTYLADGSWVNGLEHFDGVDFP